ncbi:MAG: ABC transporter substrate-binding protein [Bacteriovoracaceae bacterium]|nr:ABC transporter substrate-binding protein [Bacteriovoracaceae bacterium]
MKVKLFKIIGLGLLSFCLQAAPKLPKDIKWLSNDTDPVYASPDAKKGGTVHNFMTGYPITFRFVGPDSNGSFRSFILDNQFALIDVHPNTRNIIPVLATHWAFGSDKKTMYFKLNKLARWSDGKPVTADDFVFNLEFMRSKHIVAPWYNDYYTKEIDKVIAYDDHTLAVVSMKAKPDLHLTVSLAPLPRHFFGKLDKNFVKKYNWKIVPNTGPYQISTFKKGKHVTMKRKKDWWAKDLRYMKNRFNVDKYVLKVIRDSNIAWEHFKKNKIDFFNLTFPQYWHIKSKIPIFQKGYVNKIWFYNDMPQSASGMWLNQDRAIFKDKNVRYAFAHAMNVDKVIKKVLRGDYMRLQHGYMGYGEYTNSSIKARKFDIAKTKHYMQKAGFKRGADGIWKKGNMRFSVEVTYSAEPHTRRLVVLKEEAKKAGIELRLQKMDGPTMFKKFLEKKHDVAWMGWSTRIRPGFWEGFHSVNAHKPQTNNITNTDDKEMDKLIDAYRASLDAAERIKLAKTIQKKIHDVGCFVPTFMVPYVRRAYWRWIKLPEVPGTKWTESMFDRPFDVTTGGLFWYDPKLHKETKKMMKANKSLPPITIVNERYKMKI